MTVTDATGAAIGFVIPVNGRWAWWAGDRASLPRWTDTEGDAVAAVQTAARAVGALRISPRPMGR